MAAVAAQVRAWAGIAVPVRPLPSVQGTSLQQNMVKATVDRLRSTTAIVAEEVDIADLSRMVPKAERACSPWASRRQSQRSERAQRTPRQHRRRHAVASAPPAAKERTLAARRHAWRQRPL
ncbi:unnamed protein product [Prorocentrum cordatum]|uniref:Uncharacterized protein n=1 Tax=Prorocentrum cordatum TaxID=2364126 RepID=A0ABN9VFQ2_9DINO|nr:unnamed protein product [Polarella glacialis]